MPSNRLRRPQRLKTALALFLTVAPLAAIAASAAPPPHLVRPKLGGMIDARLGPGRSVGIVTPARANAATAGRAAMGREIQAMAAALAEARSALPGLDVRFSDLSLGPEAVSNKTGALTAAAPGAASEAIVRTFLGRNHEIYGLSASDLDDLVVLGDSSGQESGLRMLRMEQRIDGRTVFQSETRFLLDLQGRLISTLGRMVPHARSHVVGLKAAAPLSAPEAIAALLAADGKVATPARFSVTGPHGEGALDVAETDDFVAGPVVAREVYFPLAPGLLVPAWSLVVFTEGEEDWYALVDEETGAVLWRKNIRAAASNHEARFRVYVQGDGVTPADGPAPQSPNTVAPGSGMQFPEIAPAVVRMSVAQDLAASPNGWIDDCPAGGCTANESQTLGNNVLACLDRTVGGANTNVCDTDAASALDGNGRPIGNPDANGRNRDFLGTAPRDFESGFLPPPQGGDPEAGQTATGTGPALDSFRRGAVTGLFYLANWYHDRLFKLGFDEAAGNFQQTNFSGMGLGNDRVLADAEDGARTNNANFGSPPDGVSGRMQMFRFTGPTLDRDGGLDAEIVFHELTHGVSSRLVGNAAGLNWSPAQALGEGWSDFVALSLLNGTNADDANGRYALGDYANYKRTIEGVTLLDNYIYGFRRFPFTADKSVNPMTWADVDDVTSDLSGGIAPTPLVVFNNNGGMEVHNAGEVWALTLWGVRARIIADPAGANGDVPAGNDAMLKLVVNGLKMTPLDPTFTQARDALFEADCATNLCANEGAIWGGFADRGLGYGASAPFSRGFGYTSSHMGIHESFSGPFLDVMNPVADATIDDSAGNHNGALDPGEPARLTFRLTNPWRAASKAVASASATLTTSTPGVTIWTSSSTYPAIAPQGTAEGEPFVISLAPSVPCGSSIAFTLTTTSSLGTHAVPFTLRVGAAAGTDPVVTYSGTPSPPLFIPPNGLRGVPHSIVIGDDFEIADVDFRVGSVTFVFAGALSFELRSPFGIGTELISLIGFVTDLGGSNIANMVADDDLPFTADNDMAQATEDMAPYSKSWLPIWNSPWPPLAGFNGSPDPVGTLSRFDGMSTQGTWTMLAANEFPGFEGTLDQWSMLVTPVHFACTAFAPAANVAAAKSVAGTFAAGGTVTYTLILANNGTGPQLDNPGHELTDTLPSGLTLVSATATSGAATANGSPNLATWDGTLAPLGGTVTITLAATVSPEAQGTAIANQGSVSYDSDDDQVNDAARPTDDPVVGGAADPTVFQVQAVPVAEVPTLSVAGLLSLALGLAMAAWIVLRSEKRRRDAPEAER